MDYKELPPLVSAESASVFQIIIPTRLGLETIHTALGMAGLHERSINEAQNDVLLKSVATMEIEHCRKAQKLFGLIGDKCNISLAFSIGTAFLAGDGKTLWTAQHVAHLVTSINPGAATPSENLAVFVFDRSGKLVVDPYEIAVTNKFSRRQLDLPLFMVGGTSEDYQAFSLSKPIGQPLPIAPSVPAKGERITVVGYPSATGPQVANSNLYEDFSDRSPRPNSIGNTIEFSFGEVADYFYYQAVLNPDEQRSDSPQSIYTTADAVPGNSGGPVFNSRGEVIGLVSTGAYKDIDGRRRRLTGIITPPWNGPTN
jgi:hypothetical protein